MKVNPLRPLQFFRIFVTPGSKSRLLIILLALLSPPLVLVLSRVKGPALRAPVLASKFQPAIVSLPKAKARPLAAKAEARGMKRYERLPLSFEPNRGQADPHVNFLARGRGYTMFLTGAESVFAFHQGTVGHGKTEAPRKALTPFKDGDNFGPILPTLRPGLHSGPRGFRDVMIRPLSSPTDEGQGSKAAILRMRLVGANPKAQAAGLDELPGKSNYLIGNDPKEWRTNLPTYRKVTYKGVYPGIDLVYYGNQRQLEYDFVVAPGGDPSRLELAFEGSDQLTQDGAGNLVAKLGESEVRLPKPVIYQPINDNAEKGPKAAVRVDGEYVLEARNSARFKIARYDPHRPLVIDPVLVYSTYFGGSAYQQGNSIATDPEGNVYVTGSTDSVDFPVSSGAFQRAYGGNSSTCEDGDCGDVFVTKLDSTGTAMLYSTYIGGSNDEAGYAIAVDSAGDAYVTGSTDSLNFPTTPGAFQTTCKGCAPPTQTRDAFVTELNAAGSALVYSTFLGGSNGNGASGIAVDAEGNAYVAGATSSSDFPVTPGAYRTTLSNSISNAFISKLNSTGTALIYSTYVGGSVQDDGPVGIGIDAGGNAYVTGMTVSPDFPTTPGTFSIPFGLGTTPGSNLYSSYLTKLNSVGSALVYSLLLPGSAGNVAVDPSGSAYVIGNSGQFFPTTPGAPDGTCDNGGFLSRFTPDGSKLVFSDYFCAEANSQPAGYSFSFGPPGALAVDSSGNVYLGGSTGASGFPATAGAFQTQIANVCCFFDGFLMRVTPDGALAYSTYLGGNGSENVAGLSADASGDAYLTGFTYSTNFPTENAIQGSLTGSTDAFITKMSTTGPGSLTAWPAVLSFGDQGVGTSSSPQKVKVANISRSAVAELSITVTGNFTQTNNCPSGLTPSVQCSVSVVFNPQAAGTIDGTLTITRGRSESPKAADGMPTITPGGSERPIAVELIGNGVNGPVAILTPANPFWASQPIGFTSPPLTITLTNAGNSELDVSTVGGLGPHGATFGLAGDTCFAVQPQSSCTILVTFTPSFSFGGNPTYGGVTFQDNAGTGSQSLQLVGLGVADGVTFSSLGLKFAEERVGNASGPQGVFLINGLSTAITLNSITTPPDFSESNNCATTLESGAYCTLNVRFNPTSSGVHLEPLTVNDTGAGSPHTLWLLGASVMQALTVSPMFWDFPPQGDHTTSRPQMVVLTNVGDVAVSIGSIGTTGDFAETNDCGSSLTPGAECKVSVTFTPEKEGARRGHLAFAHNGSGPQGIPLTGMGVPRS